MGKLTHFNQNGQVHMVDVGDKEETVRVALAEGCIRMQPETLELILRGGHKKGDVLGVARLAGIMGAQSARPTWFRSVIPWPSRGSPSIWSRSPMTRLYIVGQGLRRPVGRVSRWRPCAPCRSVC